MLKELIDEIHHPRPNRFESLAPLPGHHEFRPPTTEPDSFAIMDKALDLGINFFDTADVYGWKRGRGSPNRSSAAGSPRAAGGAKTL